MVTLSSPEKLEYNRNYYYANRKRVLERICAYGKLRKKEKADYDRKYRLKNKEKIAAVKWVAH